MRPLKKITGDGGPRFLKQDVMPRVEASKDGQKVATFSPSSQSSWSMCALATQWSYKDSY